MTEAKPPQRFHPWQDYGEDLGSIIRSSDNAKFLCTSAHLVARAPLALGAAYGLYVLAALLAHGRDGISWDANRLADGVWLLALVMAAVQATQGLRLLVTHYWEAPCASQMAVLWGVDTIALYLTGHLGVVALLWRLIAMVMAAMLFETLAGAWLLRRADIDPIYRVHRGMQWLGVAVACGVACRVVWMAQS